MTTVNEAIRELQYRCHTLTIGSDVRHPPNMVRLSSPKQGMLKEIPFDPPGGASNHFTSATGGLRRVEAGEEIARSVRREYCFRGEGQAHEGLSGCCWGVLEAI